MENFKVPANEIHLRIAKIQKELQKSQIDGLFIVQRADLFYFSGTAQNGFLYIPAFGEPVLFIKKYLPRAKKESSIKNIIGIKSIKLIPGLIIDFYGRLPKILGLEFDVLPVREYHFYKSIFNAQEYKDASELILRVRSIKSDWEINQIKRTAKASEKTFEYIKSVIRPGISEMEFSGLYETFARKIGHGGRLRTRDSQTEAYTWHILSGKNGGIVGLLDSPASGQGTSAAFPCGAGHKLLEENEPIMVDFGFVINGYHMDETRMFAIGRMPTRAQDASKAAISIHDAVIKAARPGISAGDLFNLSVDEAKILGYDKEYLGPIGNKVTFAGHGIGTELIEPPFIAKGKTDILAPGMTFALEPKLVFENEFIAGIESVFVVTENGGKLISRVPVEIFVC